MKKMSNTLINSLNELTLSFRHGPFQVADTELCLCIATIKSIRKTAICKQDNTQLKKEATLCVGVGTPFP